MTDLRKIYEEWGGARCWQPVRKYSWQQVDFGEADILRPKLPDNLPEPSEEMMNRAVYLGEGPIKLPKEMPKFSGWLMAGRTRWADCELVGLDSGFLYCIDITDPNAREIIRLNRPGLLDDDKPLQLEVGKTYINRLGERVRIVSNDDNPDWPFDDEAGLWYTPSGRFHESRQTPGDLIAEAPELDEAPEAKPFDVDVETHPVAELLQSVLNDRIQYLLSVDEENIRQALINMGWTPPGEWLRLDEVEFAIADDTGPGGPVFLAPEPALIKIIKHGPASVRVRRKGGN